MSLAIAEETRELQDRIKAKDAEIAHLHGVISRIGGIVASVPLGELAPRQPAPRLPEEVRQQIEPEDSPGPSVDLSEEDDMGTGRWV